MAMPLGRSSNGKSKKLKTSTQDYTNLLFTDSDSDDRVPDLKLPSIKGKKQKRKRSVTLRSDDTCGIWTMFRVLLTIIIIAGMTALAAVSFWSLKKINEMENQMEKLQKSDAATPEIITNLQKNLATLNRSFSDQKIAAEEMKVNFEGIKKKIEALENTKAALDKKLDQATEMLDLPTKVTALEKTVAEMGSDVQQAKSNLEELETAINNLKETVTAPVPTPALDRREQPNDNEQWISVSKALGDVKTMNQTLMLDIAALKQQIDNQEDAFTAYAVAHSSGTDMNVDLLNKMVSDAVVEIMQNSSTSSESQRINQTNLNNMLKDVKELWSVKTEFELFKDEMLLDVKFVNSTLMTFSGEFGAVHSHMSVIDNILTNLSSFIIKDSESEKTTSTPNEAVSSGKPTQPTKITTQSPTERPMEPTEVSSQPTGLPIQPTGLPITPPGEAGQGDSTSGEKNNFSIVGITNMAELDEFFKMSDKGRFTLAEFAQNTANKVEDLRKYDANSDGYLSEKEIEIALGFSPVLKKRRKRNEW